MDSKKSKDKIQNQNDDPLFDTPMAAAYIDLKNPDTMTVWRSTKKPGQPAYHKIGRNVRYRKSELDAYLDRRLIR